MHLRCGIEACSKKTAIKSFLADVNSLIKYLSSNIWRVRTLMDPVICHFLFSTISTSGNRPCKPVTLFGSGWRTCIGPFVFEDGEAVDINLDIGAVTRICDLLFGAD